MTHKNPFDASEMMKMFDPANMMSAFAPKKSSGPDLSAIMESNKRNFDAMLAANQAAAAASQDFYQKQMAIFEEITKSATEKVAGLGTSSGIDAAEKQAEIYGAAVEKALAIMTELADKTGKANQEAFESVQAQIADAIKDLSKI